jgi:antitoxin VapB
MSKEYKAKVFKSGNSLALRLPAELGLKEGSEMVLREERSGYLFEPAETRKRKFNVEKVAGSAKSLRYIEPASRVFEPRGSEESHDPSE